MREIREMAGTVVNNGLASQSDRARAWGEMGKTYHAYELFGAAEVCYDQAAGLEPADMAWRYLSAQVARAQGDLLAAASSFSEARELAPQHLATLIHWADVELELNRPEIAGMLLDQAAAIAPGAPVVLARRGELALVRQRYGEAVELLSAALEAVPAATRLHHAIGLAFRGLGDLEQARAHLERRGDVGLSPADPLMAELETLQVGERVHLLRGRRAFQAGQFEAAASEFRQALEAEPESVRALVNLSAALSGFGDRVGAAQSLQRALEIDPENPTALFNLASLAAGSDAHGAAVGYFAAATRVAPGDEEGWLGEAKSWIALGDFGEAARRLSSAGEALPESGRIAFALARVLAASPDLSVRDGERALDLATKVFEARRTAASAELLSNALRESGRCDQAREFLDRLISEADELEAAQEAERLRSARAEIRDSEDCRPPG